MVFKVLGRGPDAFYAACKTLKRSVPRAVMPSVVISRYPGLELLVELFICGCLMHGKETAANGAEPAFYFSLPLGLIGPGMQKDDAQRRTDMLQVIASEGRSVVNVQFPRHPPHKKRLSEGIRECFCRAE